MHPKRTASAIASEGREEIFANEDVLEEASILIPADGEEEEKQLQEFREFLENVTPEDFG